LLKVALKDQKSIKIIHVIVWLPFFSYQSISFCFRWLRFAFVGFVLFRFHFVDFVLFRFVSFLLISFRFVSFRLVFVVFVCVSVFMNYKVSGVGI
jgi:hypothetical protein